MRGTESDCVPFPMCTLLHRDDVPLEPVLNRPEALRNREATWLLGSALEPRDGWEVEDSGREGERARRGRDPQP